MIITTGHIKIYKHYHLYQYPFTFNKDYKQSLIRRKYNYTEPRFASRSNYIVSSPFSLHVCVYVMLIHTYMLHKGILIFICVYLYTYSKEFTTYVCEIWGTFL